jgi:O-methyltransferase
MRDYPYTLKRRIKKGVKNAIASLPQSKAGQMAMALPRLGQWRRAYGPTVLQGRRSVHEAVAARVRSEKILYLEFGVFQGESIRFWLGLNGVKESRFVGFDTFTGLPEAWHTGGVTVAAGEFSTNGAMPQVSDPRCSFLKGLFQDTLDDFLATLDRGKFDRIVLHMDADIYSATLYVLTRMNDGIAAGDIIIFDEFSSVANELRALDDWADAYMRRYQALCASRNLDQVAIAMA